jgi:hypothetical protein
MIYAPASDAHSLQLMSNKLMKESTQEAPQRFCSFASHDIKTPFFIIDECFFNDDDENISLRKKITPLYVVSFCHDYLVVKPFHKNLPKRAYYLSSFDFIPTFISLKVLKL